MGGAHIARVTLALEKCQEYSANITSKLKVVIYLSIDPCWSRPKAQGLYCGTHPQRHDLSAALGQPSYLMLPFINQLHAIL